MTANPPALRDRYPYRHNGPSVHGSKLADYLISEANLREDKPELFADEAPPHGPKEGDSK